jgi:Uma2 family endonuclease
MIVARPKRFTLDEYHRLIDSGFFAENERIELIRGEIIETIAKGTLIVSVVRD